MGDLHFFLSIEISYQDDGMILTQLKFTKELLAASKVKEFKHVVNPLPLNTKLSASKGTLHENPTIHRSLVGKLNFLTNIRPDLAYNI